MLNNLWNKILALFGKKQLSDKSIMKKNEQFVSNYEDDEDSIIIEKEEIMITTEPSKDDEDAEVEEENEDDELSLSQKILDKDQIEDLKENVIKNN